MRIISGEFGGRKIHPPSKMPKTRPTTDIAKEGLFNIIQNQKEIAGIRTLDLFGGTGSISFELASRGAASLTVVEKDPAMHAFIKKTAAALCLADFNVLKMDVFAFLRNCSDAFDFIFAGPPYALETIDQLPEIIVSRKLLNPKGWFVLEHTPRNNYTGYPLFASQRNYGSTIFSFFINQ
jgi:16S rRNA (guanine966-N2)-methyltransferase